MMPAYGLIILNISVAKHAAGNLGGLGTESAERTEVATQRSQGSQRRAARPPVAAESRLCDPCELRVETAAPLPLSAAGPRSRLKAYPQRDDVINRDAEGRRSARVEREAPAWSCLRPISDAPFLRANRCSAISLGGALSAYLHPSAISA